MSKLFRTKNRSPGRGRRWQRGLLTLALALLAGLSGAMAQMQPSWVRKDEPVTGEREPTLRKIDWQKDTLARDRINYYRYRLPQELRRQNNFAWARADIPGLHKKEYYAHSRIQSLDSLSSRNAKRISGISPKPDPKETRFKTIMVDYLGNIGGPNAVPRWFDTEYKIMEDIASRLPDTSVEGHIQLFTNLEPCRSCWGVMKQFMAVYTNIEIEVLFSWP